MEDYGDEEHGMTDEHSHNNNSEDEDEPIVVVKKKKKKKKRGRKLEPNQRKSDGDNSDHEGKD